MSNNEILIEKNTFKEVIEKNNSNLVKNGVEVFEVKKDEGITHYIKKQWKFLRSTNRTTGIISTALELVLNCNHGQGRPLTIRVRLTQSQADYICNKASIDLFNGSLLNIRTRFVYGFRNNDTPYVSCVILFGSQVISQLFDPYQEEIFFEKMKDLKSCYDIYLDEKLVKDVVDSFDLDDLDESND